MVSAKPQTITLVWTAASRDLLTPNLTGPFYSSISRPPSVPTQVCTIAAPQPSFRYPNQGREPTNAQNLAWGTSVTPNQYLKASPSPQSRLLGPQFSSPATIHLDQHNHLPQTRLTLSIFLCLMKVDESHSHPGPESPTARCAPA